MNQIFSRMEKLPSSSFSSVMGIGIVSDALLQLHLYLISEILEYSCLAVYIGLVSVFLIMETAGWKKLKQHPFNTPSILGSFTFVAGSAVLFTRMSESGYVFLDIPAIVLTLVFTVALGYILFRSAGGNILKEVDKPYLFFVPFIAFLGISVLSSQTYSKLNIGYPYLFPLSSAAWILGFAGTIVFIIYTLVKFKVGFLNSMNLNGFYFIYSGIASLAAFSAILIMAVYNVESTLIEILFRYILIILFVWAISFSVLLFYLYFIKFVKGQVEFRHRVSFWGAVFPMGVDSMGSFFISAYFHMGFLIYLAYFYAFIGLFLIIIALVEILASIVLPGNRYS